MLEYVVEIASAHGVGQDRAVVIHREHDLLIVLADGAGNTEAGGAAAQAVVTAVTESTHEDWSTVLLDVEAQLGATGGQTTAVIVTLAGDRVAGVSVGDSAAWWIDDMGILDLTEKQIKKPLVGADCSPFAFRIRGLERGTLLVASDGLLNYAKPDDVIRLVRGADLRTAARALVELVRLPTGGLQDDVAIVLAR